MRGHLRTLTDAGILQRRRQTEFPGTVEYELGKPGRQLLSVANVLQTWLSESPDGPILVGSPAAKSAVKALIDGWNSSIVRALAARPLSLTELNRLISELNYPSLERRLVAMRQTGLIEPCPSGGRGTPYAITTWLRRAIAPLAAGASWERANALEAVPVNRLDVESAFLLTVPLLQRAGYQTGSCRMATELGRNGQERFAGVMVEVDNGEITSCVARLQGETTASAVGPVTAWLGAVIKGDPGRLDMSGDFDLARTLVDGLHEALFRYALDVR
jgi:DNA-binding HxlR family transcriptional regulator